MEQEIEVVSGRVENKYEVVLSKPYEYEGNTFESIDLVGLENLKTSDMIDANKFLERSGTFSLSPELTMEYACFMASKVTGKPIEFFYNLPPRDGIKVKNRVTVFFYGQD